MGLIQSPRKKGFPALTAGDWKVSELESVRIQFLPILEEIGKCQNRKVSELESVRIGKCQNWKVSELEIFRFFKYGANVTCVTIVIQTMA